MIPTTLAPSSVNQSTNQPISPSINQSTPNQPIDPIVLKELQDQQEMEQQELVDIVRELIRKAEDEDLEYRYNLINIAKRNELYFNNIQNIILDPVARDYRTIDSILYELDRQVNSPDIKTNNIYRAFAESLIAAMSVELPAVEFSPDNSEDPDDIDTADTYTRISVLIQRHNKAPIMLIKVLTILYNQGVVFGYNNYKKDPAFGILSKEIMGKKQVTYTDLNCPQCGQTIEADIPVGVKAASLTCKDCGWHGSPVPVKRLDHIDEVVGYEHTPKGRSQFDFFGCTYVKAPLYARNQDEMGYLILRREDHIAKFRAEFDEDDLTDTYGDIQAYERWGRTPLDYRNALPKDIATKRDCWFRPWFYRVLDDKDKVALLTKNFPTGLKATIVGETICDMIGEKLDDHWTVTFDPRCNYIHAEPAGNVMIPIQDAENDVFNLGIQCIEFGIPETFVDPRTVNLTKYAQSQATPGMMTPALPPRPDKSLADGFFTVKSSTLSNEYSTFDASLTTKGQFASGGLPSLFGGSNARGTETATEHSQNRAQALQRLQIPWRVVKDFWGNVIYKGVVLYANNLREDENYPEKSNGKFQSVWIRKSNLHGKAGQIEPEMSEQIPQSWASKKDFITDLIRLKDPTIGAILMHPNNSNLIKQYSGFPDLYIPGEHDRNKQYAEYYELADGQPIDANTPSISIDVDVDDHQAEMVVLKNILVGPLGLELKNSKPAGYMNNILHYRQHYLAQQAKTQSEGGGGAGVPPPSLTPPSE